MWRIRNISKSQHSRPSLCWFDLTPYVFELLVEFGWLVHLFIFPILLGGRESSLALEQRTHHQSYRSQPASDHSNYHPSTRTKYTKALEQRCTKSNFKCEEVGSWDGRGTCACLPAWLEGGTVEVDCSGREEEIDMGAARECCNSTAYIS